MRSQELSLKCFKQKSADGDAPAQEFHAPTTTQRRSSAADETPRTQGRRKHTPSEGRPGIASSGTQRGTAWRINTICCFLMGNAAGRRARRLANAARRQPRSLGLPPRSRRRSQLRRRIGRRVAARRGPAFRRGVLSAARLDARPRLRDRPVGRLVRPPRLSRPRGRSFHGNAGRGPRKGRRRRRPSSICYTPTLPSWTAYATAASITPPVCSARWAW